MAQHQLWFNPDGDRTKDISRVQSAKAGVPAGTLLAQTANYAYTPMRQLASVTKSGDDKSKNESYTYDGAGNVLTQNVDGVDTTFTYVKGRLDTTKAGSAPASTQTYDQLGRLTAVKSGSTTLVSYSYDGFDHLVGEVRSIPGKPGVTTSTGFDPLDRPTLTMVAPVGKPVVKTRFDYLGVSSQVAVEEQPDKTGVWRASKTYAYGPDGRPLVLVDTPVDRGQGSVPAASTQLYGYNPHGDVESLTDSLSGGVTATYRYTGYGEAERAGTTGRGAGTVGPDGASEAP